MTNDAKRDPLFEAVKQFVIETRTPSVSFIQRAYRINYSRAASMLEAMEGEIVTPKDEQGMRRMIQEGASAKIASTALLTDCGVSAVSAFDNALFNELNKLDALVKLLSFT